MKRLLLLSILILGFSTFRLMPELSSKASATGAAQWSAPRTLIAVGSTTPYGTIKVLDYNYRLNNQGHVAVRATVDNGSGSTDAILLIAGSSVTKVVAVGDPLPDGHTLQLLDESLALNDYDQVAFDGYDENTVLAVYLYQLSGLTQVVRMGDSTPLGGIYSNFAIGDLNNSRQITFTSAVLNGAYPTGIFAWSGSVTPVVGAGQARPSGGTFSLSFGAPYATSAGQVVFGANAIPTGLEIDQWNGGSSFVRLTGYGDTTSDGGTVSGAGVGSLLASVIFDGRSSESDRQVFSVLYNKNSLAMTGVFTLDNGVLNKVIADGDALPDGTIFQRQIAEQILYDPYVNSSGDVVFLGPASYTGTGRRLYVRKDGIFSTLDLAGASRPYVNDKDQVVYGVGSELRWVELATPFIEPIAMAAQPGIDATLGVNYGYIVGLDTQGQFVRNLSPQPGEYGPPLWSPDGNKLAFFDANAGHPVLRVVGTDGQLLAILPTEGGSEQFSWSPDSAKLAYSGSRDSGGLQLHVYDLGTGTNADLTSITGAHLLSPGGGLSWSSQNVILFVCGSDGDFAHSVFCFLSPDGSTLKRGVSDTTDVERGPVWSPDGNYFAYIDDCCLGFPEERVIIRPATFGDGRSDYAVATIQGFWYSHSSVVWTPDGERLVTVDTGSSGYIGGNNVFVFDPSKVTQCCTNNLEKVSQSFGSGAGSLIGKQAIDPDGNHIAIWNGSTNIWNLQEWTMVGPLGGGIAAFRPTPAALPPVVDLARSTIAVAPRSVSVGCPGSATVAVSLLSSDGNPYTQSASIQVTSSRGLLDTIAGSPATTSTGRANFAICSTTPGTPTISAFVDGSALASTASVQFTVPLRYIAAGDSIPSGVDLGFRCSNSAACDSFPEGAYPAKLKSMLDRNTVSLVNIACSGASTTQFLAFDSCQSPFGIGFPNQMGASLTQGFDLLTVTVGADDGALGGFVDCLKKLPDASAALGCAKAIENNSKLWSGIGDRILGTSKKPGILRQYKTYLASHPVALVVVTNYYNPTPSPLSGAAWDALRISLCSTIAANAPLFQYKKVFAACDNYLNDLNEVFREGGVIVNHLNDVISGAVTSVGDNRIKLAKVDGSFIGHCAPLFIDAQIGSSWFSVVNAGCPESTSWIAATHRQEQAVKLGGVSVRFAFTTGVHPSDEGQQCIANVVWNVSKDVLGYADRPTASCP